MTSPRVIGNRVCDGCKTKAPPGNHSNFLDSEANEDDDSDADEDDDSGDMITIMIMMIMMVMMI